MTHLNIDDKKYVLISEESYDALRKKAALKWRPEKTYTLEQARAHSKKLIKKWASEK
jgi:hypothetical protein